MRNTLKINWEDPGFNKELIEEYPFLKPRNVWTGEDIEGYKKGDNPYALA